MVSVADIHEALGGELHGDASLALIAIAPVATAGRSDIAFVTARHQAQVASSQAGCLIVEPAMTAAAVQRAAGGATIVTADPYLYYARLTQWWRARQQAPVISGIHATAVIGEGARIATSASIGAYAVIGDGACIGEHARIGAQTVLQDRVHIGAGSRLSPRVFVGEACVVGRECIIHSGAVVGEDGFGFAPHAGQWMKIEQLGAVRLGDHVDIGANTCIDRGALEDTVLEDGVKLDNQIQIAHNVHIGAHTAMAGCVGVAGSTHIGSRCTFGGAAMVLGHLKIADDVHVGAASVVMRSIRRAGQYSGIFPLDDNAVWEKNAAALKQLHQLRQRVRHMELNTK